MKITLCGSMRFKEAFHDWDMILTLAGHVVYSVTGFMHSADNDTDEEKRRLDIIHLEKIAQSDAIVVLNVDGYFGESTIREIDYARMLGREVYWLKNSHGGKFLGSTVFHIPHLFMNGRGSFMNISHVPLATKYMESRADAVRQEAN